MVTWRTYDEVSRESKEEFLGLSVSLLSPFLRSLHDSRRLKRKIATSHVSLSSSGLLLTRLRSTAFLARPSQHFTFPRMLSTRLRLKPRRRHRCACRHPRPHIVLVSLAPLATFGFTSNSATLPASLFTSQGITTSSATGSVAALLCRYLMKLGAPSTRTEKAPPSAFKGRSRNGTLFLVRKKETMQSDTTRAGAAARFLLIPYPPRPPGLFLPPHHPLLSHLLPSDSTTSRSVSVPTQRTSPLLSVAPCSRPRQRRLAAILEWGAIASWGRRRGIHRRFGGRRGSCRESSRSWVVAAGADRKYR